MKVAIVHDYLYDYGGAERVLEALHEIWPEAPVYTAWVDWEWLKRTKPEWQKWEMRTTWFQYLPWKNILTSPLRFLAAWVWESLDLSGYDVVISSAAWFITKGVVTRPETLHVCYCHTPPRYLYGYATATKQNGLVKLYGEVVNPGLRMYDYLAAQRVDKFVCNSEEVKRRIAKFYRREAEVIYPPVAQVAKVAKVAQRDYFLMVNRLVESKKVDVGIEAAKRAGVKLKIVGTGREETRLKQLAGGAENIEFLGYVDDDQLQRLYAECRAVVYLPEDEDFGITPVEAANFGKPVIAVKGGGVTESVVDGVTGVLMDELRVEGLTKIFKEFTNLRKYEFKTDEIKKHAEKFSKDRFKREMKELVEREFSKFTSGA